MKSIFTAILFASFAVIGTGCAVDSTTPVEGDEGDVATETTSSALIRDFYCDVTKNGPTLQGPGGSWTGNWSDVMTGNMAGNVCFGLKFCLPTETRTCRHHGWFSANRRQYHCACEAD